MPEPPSVGLITRYVLENPYPLGIGLLLLAAVLAWLALREGRVNRLTPPAVAAVLGIGVLAVGFSVTTAGEHGEAVTEQLVQAVEDNDLTGALALFDDSATFGFGSPDNPGLDMDFIRAAVDSASRYSITSNIIRMLDGYTVDGDTAIVHLGCLTEAGSYGYTPSKWVLKIERRDDAEWRITRVTCISIANRSASPNMIR